MVELLRRINPDLASQDMARNLLGEVKDFGPLAAQSQAQGVPLEKVEGGTPSQKDEARRAFRQIAQRIIDRAT